MPMLANAREVVQELRKVRQARQYEPEPVSEDLLNELLEVARWSGSSRNTQPWQFVVVTDNDELKRIGRLRPAIGWVAGAPLAIAIVLDGKNQTSEAYDEGRMAERLLIAAHMLGLGGGTAWFGDDEQQRQAKEILGVPPERTARSVVALGYASTTVDPRPGATRGGRKPLSELVSYGRLGEHRAT